MSENQDKEPKTAEEKPDSTEQKPEKRKKTNIEIYNEERIKRSQDKVTDEKEKNKLLMEELVKSYKSRADKETQAIIKDLDLENQLVVLKAREKLKGPDPNTPSIPQPLGPVKTGLEKYITKHDPYSGLLEFQIPASELMDPERNKKLRN